MRVGYRHRSPKAAMGRFGGGWQWKVGVQATHLLRSRGTVIVSLLVLDVRLDWGERPPAK